uniref:IRG-type G domain-containing protein n=1 Tax=Neogobius melanostomus TaxID=47308 RepID=A0A8C6S4Y9_9GOBI
MNLYYVFYTMKEIKTALENNDQAQAAKKAQEYLDRMKNIPLNIAITGESGSGKSTLVNALRGIRNKTEGAAPTGVKETTMEPKEYLHPEHPNIKLSDLPGIGTTKFTADKYLKHVGFDEYDFFIIVSSDRFRENDAKLAKEIQKMKKKFYFVRSKIDNSIRDEKEEDPNTKEEDQKAQEEKVLNDVRNYCTEGKSPKVFLVSGLKLKEYDFEDLCKTLMEDLPEHQRDVLQLALPNTSLEAIKQKKKTFEKKIIWLTLTSTAVAAVPIPGLSESLLRKLSDLSGVSLDDLMAEIKSPLAGVEITKDLMFKVLGRSSVFIAALALEGGARFAPLVGIPFAMALSSVTTYIALKYILDSLSDDAQNIFKKAWH